MVPQTSNSSVIRELLISLVINVGLPLLIIRLLTQYEHTTELTALSIAAVVPLLSTIIELIRHRRLDIIAIFYLLGTLTSIIAIFLDRVLECATAALHGQKSKIGEVFCFVRW